MLTDDSGLLRKMIGNMTLSDAQKDEFLKGKLNKDVLDKILNVKVNERAMLTDCLSIAFLIS